jgi:hypothetical protein
MTELKALELVQMTNADPNTPAKITVDPQFNWVFEKQFIELRNGFVPSDNSEYVKKERKEKLPLLMKKMQIVILQKQRMKRTWAGMTGQKCIKKNPPYSR